MYVDLFLEDTKVACKSEAEIELVGTPRIVAIACERACSRLFRDAYARDISRTGTVTLWPSTVAGKTEPTDTPEFNREDN